MVSRRVFACFGPPPTPRNHKDNSIFMNSIIMNSDELFFRLEKDPEVFRELNRRAFGGATGENIHEAIEILYEYLCTEPQLVGMAQGIMTAAQNAATVEGIANEEEMVNLRDRWLRRINNVSSDSEMSESENGRAAKKGFISLPIFFATNRGVLAANKQGGVKRYFGTTRAEEISYGVSWLSLPDAMGYGDTDGSTWQHSSSRSGAPRGKIVHLSTIPVLEEKCLHKLKATMSHMGQKEAIVFVHGYNTTLANATQRMAQVAYAGNFRGPAFVFSWPSNQSVASYTADEANVMWAIPDFLHTLKMLLTDMGMEKVHLLAHSMGSRLALYSLLRLYPGLLPEGSATIGRVVLAAPDFDMAEFLRISPDLAERCERITLYCSADDQALHLSRSLHGGYPRLGDFRGFLEYAMASKISTMEHLDAIDTTGTDNSWMRHAYVFDACGIILDCCVVLRTGSHPSERASLVLAKLPNGHVYWTFQTATNVAGQMPSQRSISGTLSSVGGGLLRLSIGGIGGLKGRKTLKNARTMSSEVSLPEGVERIESLPEQQQVVGSKEVESLQEGNEMTNVDGKKGARLMEQAATKQAVERADEGVRNRQQGDAASIAEEGNKVGAEAEGQEAGDREARVADKDTEKSAKAVRGVAGTGTGIYNTMDRPPTIQLTRTASRRVFMDEFAAEFLLSQNKDGVLEVLEEDSEEVGGNDVIGPVGSAFNHSFTRSKTFGSKGATLDRSRSMGGHMSHWLHQQYEGAAGLGGGPRNRAEADKVAGLVSNHVAQKVA